MSITREVVDEKYTGGAGNVKDRYKKKERVEKRAMREGVKRIV